MSRQARGQGWVLSQSGDRNKFISQMGYVLSHRAVYIELRIHKRLQPVQPVWQSGKVRTRNPKQESQYPFELKYLDRIQLNTKFKIPATWFGVTVLVLLVKWHYNDGSFYTKYILCIYSLPCLSFHCSYLALQNMFTAI